MLAPASGRKQPFTNSRVTWHGKRWRLTKRWRLLTEQKIARKKSKAPGV
jgi:hypothetical protein